MRNSFQMNCLSSVLTALFPSALICQSTVMWIKHRTCVGIIESATYDSYRWIGPLVVEFWLPVWFEFYAMGLWSAIIGKAIQSHFQRTIVDWWKVLTDEREQKYEGAWISSGRFLHVWSDVWAHQSVDVDQRGLLLPPHPHSIPIFLLALSSVLWPKAGRVSLKLSFMIAIFIPRNQRVFCPMLGTVSSLSGSHTSWLKNKITRISFAF